jgi:hypothetical protein
MRGKARSKPEIQPWHGLLCLALLAAVATVPGATAGTAAKSIEIPSRVIAHIPLAAPAGNQMVLEKQGDKRYLYIQQASKEGYTVMDVTQPEFPSIVNRQASSNDSTGSKTETDGGTAAVAEAPDPAKTSIKSVANVPESVKVMDVGDPEHPTTLQTLKNVIGFLADGGRGIFYVTNDEGVWVLKLNREVTVTAPKKKPCDLVPSLAKKDPNCQP